MQQPWSNRLLRKGIGQQQQAALSIIGQGDRAIEFGAVGVARQGSAELQRCQLLAAGIALVQAPEALLDAGAGVVVASGHHHQLVVERLKFEAAEARSLGQAVVECDRSETGSIKDHEPIGIGGSIDEGHALGEGGDRQARQPLIAPNLGTGRIAPDHLAVAVELH